MEIEVENPNNQIGNLAFMFENYNNNPTRYSYRSWPKNMKLKPNMPLSWRAKMGHSLPCALNHTNTISLPLTLSHTYVLLF